MSTADIRLTLRTLLAYMDDTLDPSQALVIGQKLAESPQAQELMARIRKIIRKRSLATPADAEKATPSDPNIVAAYLSDTLPADKLTEYETHCMESDMHLAEVAACHQILTLLVSEPVKVPPIAFRRMYGLVKGKESIPNREPQLNRAVGNTRNDSQKESDDIDMSYLLALSGKGSSLRNTAVIIGVVMLLLIGFGIAVAIILYDSMAKPVEIARTESGDSNSTKPPATTTPTKAISPPATKSTTTTSDTRKPETEPVRPSIEERPVIQPPPQRSVPEPRNDRIPICQFDGGENPVLLSMMNGSEEWQPVKPKIEIQTSDRLMSLPGFRTKLNFATGFTTELWSNLPELVPTSSVFQTSATTLIPEKGFDAEIMLHIGRLYFTTNQTSGSKVRVRFRREVWDITLADNKTEVCLELLQGLIPGPDMKPPVTKVVLFTNSGSATVDVHRNQPLTVLTKQLIFWQNTSTLIDGPRVPDPKRLEPDARYFERSPNLPNDAGAMHTRKTIEAFAKRLPTSAVIPLLAEFHTGSGMGTPQDTYGTRFAIFSSGALHEYPRIIDAIVDANNASVRQSAIIALRMALANDPRCVEKFRPFAEKKFQLEKMELEDWIKLLYGYSELERKDPEALDRLVNGLSANSVAQRELSFVVLVDIDPESQKNKTLISYDAGASIAARESAAKAWKTRINELKTRTDK